MSRDVAPPKAQALPLEMYPIAERPIVHSGAGGPTTSFQIVRSAIRGGKTDDRKYPG